MSCDLQISKRWLHWRVSCWPRGVSGRLCQGLWAVCALGHQERARPVLELQTHQKLRCERGVAFLHPLCAPALAAQQSGCPNFGDNRNQLQRDFAFEVKYKLGNESAPQSRLVLGSPILK